jgi:hypothetical protein
VRVHRVPPHIGDWLIDPSPEQPGASKHCDGFSLWRSRMEASARAREGAPRTHDVVTGLCRLSRSKKRSAFPIGMAGTGPAMTGEGQSQ